MIAGFVVNMKPIFKCLPREQDETEVSMEDASSDMRETLSAFTMGDPNQVSSNYMIKSVFTKDNFD